jgi:hypothetical protein
MRRKPQFDLEIERITCTVGAQSPQPVSTGLILNTMLALRNQMGRYCDSSHAGAILLQKLHLMSLHRNQLELR